MLLNPVEVVDAIDPASFKLNYYDTMKPVVIKNLSTEWPAYSKWGWDYFKYTLGNVKVGVYNNTKSDAHTPINKADDYMLFGDYLDMVRQGPVQLRIFLFNLFLHAPELVQDFTWPDELMTGYVKRFPMLFVGGAGSVTHMHFDIDMSHILHTQFMGRKRVLLFPFEEQYKLYRKPWEVLSLVNFEKYYDPVASKINYKEFPAINNAQGFEITLNHGDTLFMPAGYWHHMEYIDSGFAMSLRAMQNSMSGKLNGVWNLFVMRNIDTIMKKTAPDWWYTFKKNRTFEAAGH